MHCMYVRMYARGFSLLQSIQSTLLPVLWLPGAVCRGLNWPLDDADLSLQSNATVMKEWSHTATLPYAFTACTGRALLYYHWVCLL